MTLKAYIYDISIKVAALAESEEDAAAKIEQGQAQQISMDKKLSATVNIE